MSAYDPKKIEKYWQNQWEKQKTYQADDKSKKPKYYALMEFPYPSGEGLHTGHVRGYTAMDIIARKRRMEGFNVLYPIGWDAFGLPTENYALKTGADPREVTKKNTENFKKQMKALGLSFDWSREINTTDPKYYKWTQWLFLQFYNQGLAYRAKIPVNWCPKDKIVLANEEVVGGRCERCGTQVEKREKEQWMLAITKYAERLDKDLDTVDYQERIKTQQRNWIGRSEGAVISFKLEALSLKLPDIEVFTTRPDTIFGATYLVLAPEHPALAALESQIQNLEEIKKYKETSKKRTEIERTAEGKDKSGVELKGVSAINPASGEKIPIWVADYVLPHYGTGAIMAVPAHDERDYEFAKKYNLPTKLVVAAFFEDEKSKRIPGKPSVERDTVHVILLDKKRKEVLCLDWNEHDWQTLIIGGLEGGESVEEAGRREILEETGYDDVKFVAVIGHSVSAFYAAHKGVNRIAHATVALFELNSENKKEIASEENALHKIVWIKENEVEKYLNLSSQKADWLMYKKPGPYSGEGFLINSGQFSKIASGEVKKEIVKFVGGKWKTTYKLRDWIFSRQRYWGEPIPIIHCEKCGIVPVPEKDLPVLLPKVKNYKPTDTGESPLAGIKDWVNVKCPRCEGQAKRETDVMPNWAGSSWYFYRYLDPINTKTFADKKKLKTWMPVDWYNGGMEHTVLHLLYSRFWNKFLYDLKLVPTSEPYEKRTSHGLILAEGGEKMSKSKGNVINPDEIVKNYGADTLRLYEMFVGPFDQAVAWSSEGIIGPRRFLEKVWRLGERLASREVKTPDSKTEITLHKTIKKVSEDIETMSFNTAVSALMVCANEFENATQLSKKQFGTLLRLLGPFTPHITEELWRNLGNKNSVHDAEWPKFDEKLVSGGVVTIAVQVNGKTRATFEASQDLDEGVVVAEALSLEGVKKWLNGKNPKRTVYVPGRIVNIVI